MRDTAPMSAAELPATKPMMCGRCGADRVPGQPACTSPECVRELERAKPASWERLENRQTYIRHRGHRRRR